MNWSAATPRLRHLDASPTLVRALSVFLGLHGVAHFAGTEDSFTKAADGGSVDYLAGAWTLSDPTLLRAFGVVWALLGMGFLFAATVTWLHGPEWPRVLAIVAVLSLAVVIVALWSSIIGVVVNVALLVVAARAGAFSREGGHP